MFVLQVNDTLKAPASTSRMMQHSSVYHSPYRKTGVATGPHASRLGASTSKTVRNFHTQNYRYQSSVDSGTVIVCSRKITYFI